MLKDNRIQGAVLYGDTADGSWYFQLMKDKQDISNIRDNLMFGENNLGDVGHKGQANTRAACDASGTESGGSRKRKNWTSLL